MHWRFLRILNTFSKSLRSKFIFLGPVPQKQLPDIYRSTSVCVFPSLAEAFGLTCVEAMACGKPVVVTKYASGPELVENGELGLLANPRITGICHSCYWDIKQSRPAGISWQQRKTKNNANLKY